MKRIFAPLKTTRRSYTLLELVVAMVVLGVALAGLFPLLVMQSRGVESLELRYSQVGRDAPDWFNPVFRPNVTRAVEGADRQTYKAADADAAWYLTQASDPLARKLGAGAAISRTSPDAPPVTLVDDGDGTYAAAGSWGTQAAGLDSDSRRHELQATPTDAAVWTFSNVAVGWHYVMATWPEAPDLATDAKFVVRDGAADASPTTVYVNQTVAPDGAAYQGRPWRAVTMRYFRNGAATVTLLANATAAVVADAVRLVPAATILSVDKSFGAEEVTVRVKIGAAP